MREEVAKKPRLVNSTTWYIYFSVRDERTGKMVPKKIEKGFKACKTVEEKYAHAKKLIKEYENKLKQGWVPWRSEESIYEDEINYQIENQRYSKKRKAANTVRKLISSYLATQKLVLKKKSYQTYQSRMRTFTFYLESKKFGDWDVTAINNSIIVAFFTHLIREDKLDRCTVNNYRISISAFFNWMLKQKMIFENPVHDIPQAPKIKDEAPAPIIPPDLKKLLTRIKSGDRQVYLACLMQFFCAIRPGNELHSLQIKHINFWAGTITINAVAGKMRGRTINIPEQFLPVLTDDYELQSYDREYYVFGKEGKPGLQQVGNNTLRVRFNKFRDDLKLSKDYKFYSLKHTGAGFLLDTGCITIKDLQEHLGHSDINSTYQYIKKYRGMTTEKIKHNFPNPFPDFNKSEE